MYHKITNPLEGQCKAKDCKTMILFDHGGRRYCAICKIKQDQKRRTEWRVANRNKTPIERKCVMCDNTFDSTYGRITCSIKCRQDKWYIIRVVKMRQRTIEKKQKELIAFKKKHHELLTTIK